MFAGFKDFWNSEKDKRKHTHLFLDYDASLLHCFISSGLQIISSYSCVSFIDIFDTSCRLLVVLIRLNISSCNWCVTLLLLLHLFKMNTRYIAYLLFFFWFGNIHFCLDENWCLLLNVVSYCCYFCMFVVFVMEEPH